VFASDEASSEEFSMPRATIGRDDAVDGVVPVAEMAARLCEFIGAA
jgi:chemotaxis response regulator CheB